LGKSLPRVTLPGFDYARKTTERLEIPVRERLKAARAARGPRHAGPRPAGSKTPVQPGRPARHGGPRPNARGGSIARIQAILDKYAPVGSGSGAAKPPGRRRR
jgi:hypothetical protein